MNINGTKAKLNKAYEKLMRLEDAVEIAELSGKWAKWSKLMDKLLNVRNEIIILEAKYSILNRRIKDREERRKLKGDSLTEMGIRLGREILAESVRTNETET